MFVLAKKFPLYASLANTSSMHIVNILISSFFGLATLGLYSMAQKVLGVPAMLIGNAIRDVYFQKSNQIKYSLDDSKILFWNTVSISKYYILP